MQTNDVAAQTFMDGLALLSTLSPYTGLLRQDEQQQVHQVIDTLLADWIGRYNKGDLTRR